MASNVNNVIPVDSGINAARTSKKELDTYKKYSVDISQWYMDLMRDYMRQASSAQQNADLFNAEQAHIQRQWSEAMSGTAHQREVDDLRAAGLNPIISAYGSGASVGSGAAASSSNQLVGALGSIASTMASSVASLANTLESNSNAIYNTRLSNLVGYSQQATSREVNRAQMNMAKYQSDLNAQVQMFSARLASNTTLSVTKANNQMTKYVAKLNSLTSKQIARISANANISAADLHAAASNYAAEISYNAALETARMNNQTAIKTNRESTSATFEGFVTSGLKRAGEALTNWLMNPAKAY